MLLLILVGLPFGSYVYLKKGYDYRKGMMRSMKDLGALPNLPGTVAWGNLPDSLSGNLLLVGKFNPADPAETKGYAKELEKLYTQFDSVAAIKFLSVLPAKQIDSAWVESFVKSCKIIDRSQVFMLLADDAAYSQWNTGMKWPSDAPQIALVSPTGQIRAYFDLRQPERVSELVQISAMIAPRVKKEDIIFQREAEK
jgi:hypothetical protein